MGDVEVGDGGIAARSSSRGRGIGSVFTAHFDFKKLRPPDTGKSPLGIILIIDVGKGP